MIPPFRVQWPEKNRPETRKRRRTPPPPGEGTDRAPERSARVGKGPANHIHEIIPQSRHRTALADIPGEIPHLFDKVGIGGHVHPPNAGILRPDRSEERRVGKYARSRRLLAYGFK